MDMFHSKLWVYQRVSRAKKNPVGSIPMKNTDIRRPTSDIGGTPTGSKEVWRVVFRTRNELEPRFVFFRAGGGHGAPMKNGVKKGDLMMVNIHLMVFNGDLMVVNGDLMVI